MDLRRRQPRAVPIWALGILLGIAATGCEEEVELGDRCAYQSDELAEAGVFPGGDDPFPPPKNDPDQYEEAGTLRCEYLSKLATARNQLESFKGEAAAESFASALSTAEAGGFDRCQPLYGAMLGHTQDFLAVINNIIAGLVDTASSLSSADTSLAPMASSFYLQDFGEQLTNYYLANFREPLEGMAARAAEISELATEPGGACAFEFAGGVPFRLGNNTSPERLKQRADVDPDTVGAELNLGERWDTVEAEGLKFFADNLVSFFYFWMAHRIELNEEQLAQLTGRLVKDFADPVLSCINFSSDLYGEPIDPAVDENDNGIVDTADECLALSETPTYHFTELLRIFGWLVGDNPKTLASHVVHDADGERVPQKSRWDTYMFRADDRCAAGWGAIANIFDALVARSARHAGDSNRDEVLRSYAVSFDDAELDGQVNQGDSIGLNVVDISLKLPAAVPETQATSIEDAARLVLSSFLQLSISSNDLVDLLQSLFDRVRDQCAAVDDDSLDPALIRFVELGRLLQGTSFFGDNPPPDALAIDLTAYYSDPVSVRGFFPYWEAVTTDAFEGWVNEFIIEEELPPGIDHTFPWQVTAEAASDATHFTSQGYLAFDPAVDENEPTAAIPGTELEIDCMLPADHPPSLLYDLLADSGVIVPSEGMLYAYFQNPSLNGLILVDTQALDAYTEGGGSCSLSAGFEPATLHSLHMAGIAHWRWFLDEFAITELLNTIGG